jgi:hypothetical protein
MDRVINFIHWYRQLKAEGVEMGWDTKELAYHTRYNTWNCLRWAIMNSGTHYTDGSYFDEQDW